MNYAEHQEAIKSEEGLCPSIACSDIENYRRIRTICETYFEHQLECSPRSTADWIPTGLPMNFESYRYRVARGAS